MTGSATGAAAPLRWGILGTEDSIELTEPWEAGKRGRPGTLVLHAPAGAATESRVIDADRPLYALEADAFADVVSHGQVTAPLMSTDDSLGNMRALGQWRVALPPGPGRLTRMRVRKAGGLRGHR